MPRIFYDPHILGYSFWPNKAGEKEMVCQPRPGCGFFKPSAVFPVANEQEFDRRITTDQLRRDRQQVFMTLQPAQPGNFADNEVLWADTQAGAKIQIITRS